MQNKPPTILSCKQRLQIDRLPHSNKDMIDFLRLMQESKVYSKNEIKEKCSNAEKRLLGEDKSIPADDDSDGVASESGL